MFILFSENIVEIIRAKHNKARGYLKGFIFSSDIFFIIIQLIKKAMKRREYP
ncbi:MAG: hypothetical protein PHW54_04605 [Candidatus Omnitrophica bacterium]|nr:hypothetical protein [Candidatus Omnitrophota bacterium]